MKQPDNYRPEIDGLRAIAVMSVVFFHLELDAFSGGFVGVDIFFVISGFLITRIIINEADEGRFSFRNFYIRRARRLLPSLAFTLLAASVAALLLLNITDFNAYLKSMFASAAFVANFFFWKESGYFGSAAEFTPLLHLWSLGVEEQFYLVWPLALLWMLYKSTRVLLPWLIGCLAAISLGLNLIFAEHATAIFFLTPFRVFELLLGALLVWGQKFRPSSDWLKEATVLIGLVLIGYSVHDFSAATVFPSLNALIPCVGAALIIYSGKTRYCAKLLCNRVAIGIGLVSYSLYLVHWPAIVFFRFLTYEPLTSLDRIGLFAFSLVTAGLMYKYIEQPFRIGRQISSYDPARLSRLSTLSIVLLITTLGSAGFTRYQGAGFYREPAVFNESGYGGDSYPWRGKLGRQDVEAHYILYGDSHAKQYLTAMDKMLSNENHSIEFLLHSACMSLPGVTNLYRGRTHESCLKLLDELEAQLSGNNKGVILAYRWPKTIVSRDGQNPLDGKFLAIHEQEEYFNRLSQALAAFIRRFGTDRRYIIVGNVPSARLKHGYIRCIGLRSRPISECHHRYDIKKGEMYAFRARFAALAARWENVHFVDPYDVLCGDAECFVVNNGQLYYSDHAHLTKAGATLVIDHFRSVFLPRPDSTYAKANRASRE